jgi:hypothetical protein
MGRAADISVLDILPVDMKSAKGFGRSFINFTCNARKTWTNTFNNKTYSLPDQISWINNLPFSLFETRYSIEKDFESIKHTLAVGVGVDYKIGMFSASSSYKNSLVSIMNQNKYLASVDSFFSGFQVDFTPYWSSDVINGEFLKFINTVLPDIFDGNEERYYELFETFGTHYFSSGLFGGMYRMTFELNRNLFNTLTSNQIELYAKASFINSILNLTGNANFTSGTEHVSEEFKENSRIIKKHYGGNVFEDIDNNYQAWVKSLIGEPWLFGGYLRPISYLFPDSLSHKKIQSDIASIVYFDKAYLVDIKNILNFYIEKVIEKEIGQKLIHSINELQKERVPNHDNVTQIKSYVDDYLKTARNSYGSAKIQVRHAIVRDSNVFFKLDPYCVVYADNRYIGQTGTARSTSSPHWDQTFIAKYININSQLTFCIWDANRAWDNKQIGCGSTTVQKIIDKNLEGIPNTENSYRDYSLELSIWWIPNSD